MSYNKHTWVNNVDAVDEDKMNHIENGIKDLDDNKVNKSGDTLTGELFFNNTDGYGVITKYRTASGTNYSLALGLGANGATRLENRGGANNTSLEVRPDGHIWNATNNKKLGEVANLTWGSSLTFSLDVGRHALVMVGSSDCLMLWMAGGETLNITRLLGTGVQATSSGTTVTIKYSDNRNFTGNAIIT